MYEVSVVYVVLSKNKVCWIICSFFIAQYFVHRILLLISSGNSLQFRSIWTHGWRLGARTTSGRYIPNCWLIFLINLNLWKYTNWSITGNNLFHVDKSSSEIIIYCFLWAIWPLQSIRSILFNEILISPSGVIYAQSIEFGDRYVSTFADLSLLLKFQPIIKNLDFIQGTMIPGVVMRHMSIAIWIIFEK